MSEVYQYKVLVDGKITSGRLEANSRQDALKSLTDQGKKTIFLDLEQDKQSKNTSLFSPQKLSFDEIERFLRQLSNLLTAGVPLSQALSLLCTESSSELAKSKWKELHQKVSEGHSLAAAMSTSSNLFPKVTIAMVQAGEAGGFLGKVLEQIADFKEREKEIRSKVITASIYPILLATLSAGVLIFLMVFFIPRFQKIFSGFGSDLPALTLIIVHVSEVIRDYGLWLLIAIIVPMIFLNRWASSEHGKRHWEPILINTPMIGKILLRLSLSRFCRTLGTLLQAGVPLLESIEISRQALSFNTMVASMNQSIDRLRQGESLAKCLNHSSKIPQKLFDRSCLEIIAVAEESSRLDLELIRLAESNEKELDRSLKTAVSLIEPLMLIVIAAIIGIIFIGMVVPIFSIQDYIQ